MSIDNMIFASQNYSSGSKNTMKIRAFERRPRVAASMFVATLMMAEMLVSASAQQRGPATVSVSSNDLGGVVRSARGPEAGVWVIAETTDTPTRYRPEHRENLAAAYRPWLCSRIVSAEPHR
jgi:hypothetical protein